MSWPKEHTGRPEDNQMKGVDVMPYAVHVKGVETGAHGTERLDMNR